MTRKAFQDVKSMESEDKEPISETCKWFLTFTSIGGLSQLHNTNLYVSKLIWFLLLVLGAIMTLYSVQQVINDYRDYNVTTRVTMETEESLYFPAVTICNQNKIHCGNLHEVIEECIGNSSCAGDHEKLETYCDLYVYGQCGPSVNKSEKFMYGEVSSKPLCEDISVNIPDEVMADYNMKRAYFHAKFAKYFSRLSEHDVVRLSHQPEKMFRKCIFESQVNRDKDCTSLMTGVQKFLNPRYGACYSFNYRGPYTEQNDVSPRQVLLHGPFYGLNLEIDIEGSYYLRNGLTEHEGVVVVIHDPHHHPLISSANIDVLPNTATNLALSLTEVLRAQEPFRTNCSHSWKRSSFSHILDSEMTYDSSLCQNLCLHQLIQNTCNCSIEDLMSLQETGTYVFCNQHPRNDTACVEDVLISMSGQKLAHECTCPSECETHKLYQFIWPIYNLPLNLNLLRSYEAHISTSEWPSKHYWIELASAYNISYHGEAVSPEDALAAELNDSLSIEQREIIEHIGEHVMENFLQLKVYFSSKVTKKVIEEPKYNFFSFLASLGGAFSLYLGMSFIVLFEFFEIIIRFLLSIFQTRKQRGDDKVKPVRY